MPVPCCCWPFDVKRGGEARKRKTALRVSCRVKALQNPAIVASKTPVVFAVIPNNGVGHGIGLVEFAPRRRIAQAGKGRKVDSRNAPIKWICGDAANLREGGDIRDGRIQIGRRNMVVVVVEAQVIRGAPFAVDPARIGVQALRAGSAGERRKWADDIAGRLRPAHAHIEVVLRPAPPPPPPPPRPPPPAPRFPCAGAGPKLWMSRRLTESELLSAEVTK